MDTMRIIQSKLSNILMRILIKLKRGLVSFLRKELRNGHNKRNELMFKMLKFLRNA
jgi:hypothetical protein